MDLYTSTNGATWTHNTNWRNAGNTDFNDPGTECTWYGVTCDGGGTTVQQLNPHNNHLVGTLPASLGSFTDLQYLDLSYNQLTGSIPAQLGDLANLQYLDLFRNQLTGPIPPALGNITNLQHLNLQQNQFSGSIPPQLGSASNLQYLALGDNQLTGSIPTWLGNLTNLQYLSVETNQLSGQIPPELGNLVSLLFLSLGSNQLTGSIPVQLGSLANLEILFLHNNQLTGSIPPQLGSLTKLNLLYLNTNQLTGSIPTQLGNLAALTTLTLDHNQLTGSIPTQLGGLANLGILFLNSNRLTGSVPTQFANLASLWYLNLSGNMLSGAIPTSLESLNLHVGDLDLRYKAVYSTDAALTTFLNGKQVGGDWQSTQTIAPAGVAAGTTTTTSVLLSWAPIVYIGDTGGYRAYYSKTSAGPYTSDGITADKTVSTIVVNGLNPGTLYYFVVRTVTNPSANNQNTVTSDPSAEVHATTNTSCTPPSISSQPLSQTIQSGQTATLSVTATGTASLSYQWYQGTSGNTSHPVGTNSRSFITPALTTTTSYWVRVSNACGHADSATATVSISCTPPSITGQPQNQSIQSGQTATLSVSAAGTPPLSYQWYQGSSLLGWTPVGTNVASLTTSALTAATSFFVRVSNACGHADSNPATVSVTCAPPSITTQPQSQSILRGQTAPLSVIASGTTPLSYQWYQGNAGDTSTPVGDDASTFTTPPLIATTSFWVRVTNACGTADSATVGITVRRGPRRHLYRAT